MSKQLSTGKSQKVLKRKLSIQTQLTLEQKSKQAIQDAKMQLDEMINHIDDKVRNRLQVNQNRFLYAYRNHLERITREMKLLKEHYDAQQTKFSTDKAINQLAKQCALFRQQAVRLSNQLEDALTEIDIYRRKSEILERQNKQSDEMIKNLMKMNKQNQIQKSKLIIETSQKQKTINTLNKDLNQSRKFQATTRLKTQQAQTSARKIPQRSKQNNSLNKSVKNIEISELFADDKQAILHQIQNITSLDMQQTSYPVFQLDRPKYFVHTPRSKSFKSSNHKHNRTQSTNDYYNCSQKQINAGYKNQADEQTEKQQRKTFNQFIRALQKARSNHCISDQKRQIQSKSIDQFILNDFDLQILCHRLFPNLQINQKLQIIDFVNAEPSKKQYNKHTKNNNQQKFSYQFLRKFNFSNLIQKVSEKEKQRTVKKGLDMQVDNFNINLINKKSKMKTEQQVTLSNDFGLARLHSMHKMNEVFKRKDKNKKSLTNKAHMSARRHTDIQSTK